MTEREGVHESLHSQVDRLAKFIMEYIPGEPSRSEGAIDTAIRLLADREESLDARRLASEELWSDYQELRRRVVAYLRWLHAPCEGLSGPSVAENAAAALSALEEIASRVGPIR